MALIEIDGLPIENGGSFQFVFCKHLPEDKPSESPKTWWSNLGG